MAGAATPAARIRSGAVGADRPAAGGEGDPAAVLDQETAGTGELVGLLREHRHGQLFPGHTGQISAGQFDAFGGVALVEVDVRGLRFLSGGGDRVQRLGVGVLDGAAPGRVVISCRHGVNPSGKRRGRD